jgi:hypothetical protein
MKEQEAQIPTDPSVEYFGQRLFYDKYRTNIENHLKNAKGINATIQSLAAKYSKEEELQNKQFKKLQQQKLAIINEMVLERLP